MYQMTRKKTICKIKNCNNKWILTQQSRYYTHFSLSKKQKRENKKTKKKRNIWNTPNKPEFCTNLSENNVIITDNYAWKVAANLETQKETTTQYEYRYYVH